jgi:hypothetical protein
MMNTIFKYSLFLLLLVGIVQVSWAQATLLEVEAKQSRNYVTINNAASNNKPNAILIVTQSKGIPQPVGVLYRNNKWEVFHQNKQNFRVGTKFNVLVLDPAKVKNAFVHRASSSNTDQHITIINHAKTDNKANVKVFVTPRYEKTNAHPVGVWYSQNKWKIYNENRKAIPIGMAFNVLVMPDGKVSGLGNNITGECYSHTVKDANRYHNSSYLKTKNTSTKIFVTQNWKGTRSAKLYGVNYIQTRKKWAIQVPSSVKMANGYAYNVMALDLGIFMVMDPTLIVLEPKPKTDKPIKTRPNGKDKIIKGRDYHVFQDNKAVVIDNKNPINRRDLYVDAVKHSTEFVIVPPFMLDLGTADEPDEVPDEEEISLEAEGPNVALGKDLGTVLTEPDADYFISKLNIYRDLYEDKNKHSGYFYYLPANYSLKWDQVSGKYSFYLQYLSQNGDDDAEDVFVTFELAPNIKKEDIELAEYFISKKMGKEIKLRPMILQSKPEVSSNALAAYGVKNQSISVPTDFLQPMVVSWNMGSRVDDFTNTMTSGLGVNGDIIFEPYSENPRSISVTTRLKVNHEQTYGKLEYEKASSLLNGFTIIMLKGASISPIFPNLKQQPFWMEIR